MTLRPRAFVVLAVAAVLPVLPSPTATAEEGTHSANMTHVKNLPYPSVPGRNAITNGGTDIEFVTMTLGGEKQSTTREFALAGSYDNGLQIVDITDPTRSKIVARYDCAIRQGDVQVFTRGARTLVTYTQDDPYNGRAQHYTTSRCYEDAKALGMFGPGVNPAGTFIVDISNPYSPKTVSFLSEPRGSHNQTVAPGGRYLYNSNSDLNAKNFQIEVWDISNLRAPKPAFVLNTQSGLSSHDITFNESGTRAYSAAITHTLVLDTTELARPTIIGRIIDPAVNIHHQSDPVTLTDPRIGEKRTFLVVTDEIAGAAGNGVCPGGGLHIYDITGDRERNPVKVGFWNMPEVQLTTDNLTCTSHVLRMYPEHGLMTIAWYAAGVRVVDISGLVGVSVGVDEGLGNVGVGMKEVGYFYFPNSDTWSVKTNKIEPDGSFYLYGNDLERGLDVYRFSASAPAAAEGGTWLSASQARAPAGVRTGGVFGPYCLYRGLEAA